MHHPSHMRPPLASAHICLSVFVFHSERRTSFHQLHFQQHHKWFCVEWKQALLGVFKQPKSGGASYTGAFDSPWVSSATPCMWKLGAGVGVWRWPEARLILQKFLGPTSCILPLSITPVYPCWQGDCRHLIYPQSARGRSSPQGASTTLGWLCWWTLCHGILCWWPCSLHQTVKQVTPVAYHQKQQYQAVFSLQSLQVSELPRKTQFTQALDGTTLHSCREQTEQDQPQ